MHYGVWLFLQCALKNDVVAQINVSGVPEDEFDTDGKTYWVLYYEGKPVGRYYPNQGKVDFHGKYDPATLAAQQDDDFLGRATADDTAVADLTPGKTYNVYEIGANEIHLEGTENVGGTVITPTVVDRKRRKFIK